MGTIAHCVSCTWSGDEAKTECIFDSLLQDYVQICPICQADTVIDEYIEREEYGLEYIEEEDY